MSSHASSPLMDVCNMGCIASAPPKPEQKHVADTTGASFAARRSSVTLATAVLAVDAELQMQQTADANSNTRWLHQHQQQEYVSVTHMHTHTHTRARPNVPHNIHSRNCHHKGSGCGWMLSACFSAKVTCSALLCNEHWCRARHFGAQNHSACDTLLHSA